ncbi:hypothetical protein [Chroococcidiopsis sp.]|uniref:hypothetical protein n=1 Tax=Chroococcidiopsis sp. TaxID=3088168 RepID=UPI003F35F94B
MSVGERREFDKLARFNTDVTQIHKWLILHGYDICLSACYKWWNDYKEIGAQAQMLNQLAEAYDGLEGDRSLQSVEGIALAMVRQLTSTYQQAPNKLDPDIIKLFALVPSLMREARSSAAQREQMKFISDRAALELAGAQRMVDILLLAFKDTSYEDALKEAVQGAMLQIEQEVKGQQ